MAAMSLCIAALAAAACGGDSYGAKSSATPAPTVAPVSFATTTLTFDDRTIPVEVASTIEQTSRGLGFRDSLDADAGMIFDMHGERDPGFWMRGMRFPLDFVWIDTGRRVIGVTRDVQPQPGAPDSELVLYHPPAPVGYVLELNAGAAERLGIGEGTELRFELPAAAP